MSMCYLVDVLPVKSRKRIVGGKERESSYIPKVLGLFFNNSKPNVLMTELTVHNGTHSHHLCVPINNLHSANH